jgi:hypothetical protein
VNDKANSAKTKLPDMNLAIPGKFDTKIGQMTAEAVKASGLKVAADLMNVAEQARATATAIEEEAMEIATAIEMATSGLADRIAQYVTSCGAAADSFRQHREALATLPTLTAVIDESRVKMNTETIAEMQKALETTITN